MKLEFLPDGSPDCPLVRVYEFSCQDAEALHRVFVALSRGKANDVALHELPGVEAISGCRVRLKGGPRDRGGRVVSAPAEIEWQLTPETWDNVAGLTEPFCERTVNWYQWLDETGPVSLLLSPDGCW